MLNLAVNTLPRTLLPHNSDRQCINTTGRPRPPRTDSQLPHHTLEIRDLCRAGIVDLFCSSLGLGPRASPHLPTIPLAHPQSIGLGPSLHMPPCGVPVHSGPLSIDRSYHMYAMDTETLHHHATALLHGATNTHCLSSSPTSYQQHCSALRAADGQVRVKHPD